MPENRADRHDLDKLARWRSSLRDEDGSGFPFHAVFLVSQEDLAAHRAFRSFRSSFDARSATFQHLVIFGQHGVSTTATALARELDLDGPPPTPLLVLFSGASALTAHVLVLPAGDHGEETGWAASLSTLEEWADGGERPPDLAELPGTRKVSTPHTTVADLAGSVAAQLAPGGGRA